VKPGWKVVEQERHRIVHLARLDEVIVVQDQHHVVVDGSEVVEEGGEHRLDGQGLRILQELECRGSHRRSKAPQPGDDVGPEVRRVVVTSVQGEPGRGGRLPALRAAGQPFGEKSGLAEACRGGDQDELRLGAAV
jgi:hypothetical protein